MKAPIAFCAVYSVTRAACKAIYFVRQMQIISVAATALLRADFDVQRSTRHRKNIGPAAASERIFLECRGCAQWIMKQLEVGMTAWVPEQARGAGPVLKAHELGGGL